MFWKILIKPLWICLYIDNPMSDLKKCQIQGAITQARIDLQTCFLFHLAPLGVYFLLILSKHVLVNWEPSSDLHNIEIFMSDLKKCQIQGAITQARIDLQTCFLFHLAALGVYFLLILTKHVLVNWEPSSDP